MISSSRPARKGRWRPHFPAKISGKSAAQSGCKQAVALETPSTSHSREKKSLRPWGYFLPSLSIPGKNVLSLKNRTKQPLQQSDTARSISRWAMATERGSKGWKKQMADAGRKNASCTMQRGEGEVKKNHGRSRGAWVAGAVSQPANSGAISQHPVFRAAASWMMADAAFSLVALFH